MNKKTRETLDTRYVRRFYFYLNMRSNLIHISHVNNAGYALFQEPINRAFFARLRDLVASLGCWPRFRQPRDIVAFTCKVYQPSQPKSKLIGRVATDFSITPIICDNFQFTLPRRLHGIFGADCLSHFSCRFRYSRR